MKKRKSTKQTATAPDLDPATVAHLKTLARQRKRASRTLLNRRRRKSGQ